MSKKIASLISAPDLPLELGRNYIAKHPTRFIFPIKPGAKFPPLIKDNLEQASDDPEQIQKWTEQFPRM